MAAPAATSLAGLGSSGSSFSLGPLLGGLIGSAVGFGANALSSHKAYKRQRELMKLQAQLNYDYNRQQTLNQYGWMRQGLTKANYNPLLALQGSQGASSQSWAGSPASPQADFTGLAGDFSNASGLLAQNAQLKSQLENIASSTELNRSNVNLNIERGLNLMADSDLKISEKALNEIHKENLPDKYKSEIYSNYVHARSSLLGALANQTAANASQINANANRIKVDSDVRFQDQQIESLKHQMHLTDAQTDQIRQIIRWYGYEHGASIIRDLAMSGYFGTGAVKNLTGAGKDVLDIGSFLTPGNPVGF